jgi:hypothetical protein
MATFACSDHSKFREPDVVAYPETDPCEGSIKEVHLITTSQGFALFESDFPWYIDVEQVDLSVDGDKISCSPPSGHMLYTVIVITDPRRWDLRAEK